MVAQFLKDSWLARIAENVGGVLRKPFLATVCATDTARRAP